MQIQFESVHCILRVERPSHRVLVLRIDGTDVGEFGDAPMKALDGWMTESGKCELFIDAREVRGASIEVSGDWAAWLTAHKNSLSGITMLTGSRFIEITAEFVRRFANLEGMMRICSEPAVFDYTLASALRAAPNNLD